MEKHEEQWLKTIGSKLRSYEEPAPAEGWNRLAEELQATEPAPVRRLWIGRPAVRWVAAAVLLGLVGTIGWQWQRSERLDEVVEEATALYATMPQHQEEAPVVTTSTPMPMVEAVSLAVPRRQTQATPVVILQEATSSSVVPTEEAEPAAEQAVAQTVQSAQTAPAEQPDRVKTARKSLPYTPAPEKTRRKRGSGWSLGVAGQSLLADGGRSLGQSPVYSDGTTLKGNTQLTISNQIVKMEGVPCLTLSQKAAVDYDHKQPITFGLTVRKQLGAGFSIESGLTYTLLASDVYAPGWTVDVSQKLHYVGLPLRAAWTFYEGRRLRAYVSAGGAVEKCVQARQGGEHLSVHPLQWSLAGAVGAELKLTSHLGLYLEPGVAHYFDDGSAIQTIRKEHPTALSWQTGLRLSY